MARQFADPEAVDPDESGDDFDPRSPDLLSETEDDALRARLRQRQHFVPAVLAGLVAGAIGAFLWGGVTGITGLHVELVWLPMLGMGLFVGKVMAFVGRGVDARFGWAGAAISLLTSAVGYTFSVVITAAWQIQIANNVEFAGLLDRDTLTRLVVGSLSWADGVCLAIAAYEGYRFARLPISPASLEGLQARWSWPLVAVLIGTFPALVLLTWLSVSRRAVADLGITDQGRLAVLWTSVDGQGEVDLWDPQANLIVQIADPSGGLQAMAVVPGAERLAVVVRRLEEQPRLGEQGLRSYGAVTLWDAAQGVAERQLTQRAGTFYGALRFTPGGKELVVCDRRATDIFVWDVAADAVRASLPHDSPVRRIALAHDGDTLAVATADGAVTLWNLRGPGRLRVIPGVAHACSDLDFSPDGTALAVTDALSRRVIVLDVQAGNERTAITSQQDWLTRARFSPDGRRLAIGGGSYHGVGTVELWDTAGQAKQAEFTVATNTVRTLVFTPDSAELIAGSSQSCRLSALNQQGEVVRWKVGKK